MKLKTGNLVLVFAFFAFFAVQFSWAVDVYPTEAWPADSAVQALNGQTASVTGLPYIAQGTNALSTPPLRIQMHRRDARLNDTLASVNQLRVVKIATALRIGVFPGDYVINGTRTHYDGVTSVGSGTLTGGDDTYYVYLDNANALQIVTDATGWPADVSQFVPLAEVTVAGGAVTAIADRRGWSRTVIPQSGGASIDGTDSTFFVLDQDNGSAGANQDYRFNRGSSGADAGLRWNETDGMIEALLSVTGPTLGTFRASQFVSTVSTGTKPFTVTSVTKVDNLNADAVDGIGFSAAPAAANGVCYSTSTSAAAFTGAATAADVLYANGSAVPTWGAIGATSGVQAFDADLDAILALSGSGFAARTGTNTWALRTPTAGNNITVVNGDGVSGNPVISVSGATQYAVQVGSAAGALNSVTVGSDNTVLCGNTGANPNFRTIVNADINTGASIAVTKLNVPSDGDVNLTDGKLMLNGGGIGMAIVKQLSVSALTETSNTRAVRVVLDRWTDDEIASSNAPGLCDVWLSDSTDGELTATACTSIAMVGTNQLLVTYTSGKMWKLWLKPFTIGDGQFTIEYTGGAKTWYLFVAQGGVSAVYQLDFS